MQVIYDPLDSLDVRDYGIDIPISFNNARRTFSELQKQFGSRGAGREMQDLLLPWYHSELGAPPVRHELCAVHDPAYIDRLLDREKTLEREILRTFELVDENGRYNRYDPDIAVKPLGDLFDIVLRRGGGVIRAAELALSKGEAWYFGGGFHHAHWDYGSGFCFYSDTLAARIRVGSPTDRPLTWIIDVDAHKGDGTADLVKRLRESGDNGVIALSVHMAGGWPLDEHRRVPGYDGDPAWIPSDIDVPVESGAEGEYNSRLAAALGHLRDLSRKFWGRDRAELAFIVAGADPFEEDQLPSTAPLKLNREQMLARNMLIRDFLGDLDVPGAWVQAGNYGEHSWKTYYDFLSTVLKQE